MNYIKLFSDIAQAISIPTMRYNIKLKKKLEPLKAGHQKNPLYGSFWSCYHFMPEHQQRIHFERAKNLFLCLKDGKELPTKEATHTFFVEKRINEGYELDDHRKEPVWSNGGLVAKGKDPFLLPFGDLPEWVQEWNIDRNIIALKETKNVIYSSFSHYY